MKNLNFSAAAKKLEQIWNKPTTYHHHLYSMQFSQKHRFLPTDKLPLMSSSQTTLHLPKKQEPEALSPKTTM
jgi:hypothetical protein